MTNGYTLISNEIKNKKSSLLKLINLNIKLIISYDGSKFLGSQSQPNKLSVEDCFQKVLKRLNIDTKIYFSGRTDKDVHATNQVINFLIPKYWNNLNKLKEILNYHLPNSIVIKNISIVDDNFHSRYSAKKRVYRYILTTKQLTPFNSNYITYYKNIDEKKIQNGIKEFIGIYDFEYFAKGDRGTKTTIREIFNTKFYKYKDYYIFNFCANGFLRGQIRLMVGFLLKISDGDLSINDLKAQLNKEIKISIKPAKPNGLYLSKIIYEV